MEKVGFSSASSPRPGGRGPATDSWNSSKPKPCAPSPGSARQSSAAWYGSSTPALPPVRSLADPAVRAINSQGSLVAAPCYALRRLAALTTSHDLSPRSCLPSPASGIASSSWLPILRSAAPPAPCRFAGPWPRQARRRAAPPPRNPAHRPEGPATPLPCCRTPV